METNMAVIDHLFFFILAVVYPIMAFFSFRKLKRRIAAGESISPAELYRSTMIGHWILFATGIAIWLIAGRAWGALGFSLEVDTGFLIGVVLTIVAIIALSRHFNRLRNAGEAARESFQQQIGDLDIMMPRKIGELRYFYALSATAGIVEEVLWRGFMFWYLGQFVPLWAAAIASAVLFGLGHAYQGWKHVPMVVLVGGVFGALYLLTGSIWLPIILHAALDAVQGRAAYGILSRASRPQSLPAQ